MSLISPKDLTLGAKLGGGHFGEVYLGTMRGLTTVAVKKLKDVDTSSLLSEAALMRYNDIEEGEERPECDVSKTKTFLLAYFPNM